jgi:acyl carrier protein
MSNGGIMPLTMEEIEQLVGIQLGLKRIRKADRIVEDLGAESADIVNLIAAVEDRYGIVIEEEEVPAIRTVEDLYLAVENKRPAGRR